MRLFHVAVKGKALSWLERQPARRIPTWDDLSQKFFSEFFSIERYNQMVNDITNFTQSEGETICAAWNRFKDLMRCPHYNLTAGNQVRIFFNGCKPEVRMVLNGAAGGTIKSLRANETLELIERMATNENEGLSSKPKRGILQLEGNDVVLAANKLLSQQMATLTERLDKKQLSNVQTKVAAVVSEYCKDNHESNECPSLLSSDPPQQMHVNGIWYDQRPLPQNIPRNQNFPSGSNFQRRVQGTETRANTKNTNASIRNLENQISQLAKQIADRTPGTFPSNTITNPKEDCTAITTRSGKVVAAPEKPNINVGAEEKFKEVKEPEKEVVIPFTVEKPFQKGEEEEQMIVAEKKKFVLSSEYVRAMAPYPEIFKKDAQKQQYARFLNIFKKLHVNIAFVEALKKFPPKLRDAESFNIPIAIGNINVGKALCDLGASINLMPLSVYKSLGISELKPTMVSLQLADKSLRKSNGIIEDFLVKVDKGSGETEKSSSQELDEELEAHDIVHFKEEKNVAFEVFEKKDDDKEDGALKVELKELPETLKYIFLSDEETYPVIINKGSSFEQERRLIEVLKEHKTAIRWSVSDLKGIDPSFCTHKIDMEDDVKHVRKPQRRHNPTMKKILLPSFGLTIAGDNNSLNLGMVGF
ncbi:uncharacterized protein LOC133289737 [Gastrolobium bilobum]|uniref:uncharacterized protein LOC133289737 n=1 Tax=Gastrolobium bilobum TaxID=150636 RepID=UPI002AB10223|nr:uncharacterized protein LOC133289737 [Gastrolobium bilobum]